MEKAAEAPAMLERMEEVENAAKVMKLLGEMDPMLRGWANFCRFCSREYGNRPRQSLKSPTICCI